MQIELRKKTLTSMQSNFLKYKSRVNCNCTNMKKLSQYTFLLLLILIIVLLYAAIIFLQTSTSVFLGIVILWAIILPVLSNFDYSFIYVISLPAPIFGTWFLLTSLFVKFFDYSVYWAALTPLLSVLLVFVFHMATRRSTMFWKVSKSNLSRGSIGGASVIFIFFGMVVLNPSVFSLNFSGVLFYFSVALLAYIASSMLYSNYHYRLFTLSSRIGVTNLKGKLRQFFANIEEKFSNQENDVEMLRYYVRESLFSYLDGDFERSYVWGYKVIRESTAVNPTEYVDDKREGLCSFSEIRNTLQHSRRKGHVDANEVRLTIKNLYKDCIDLLEREFELVKKIAE